MERSSRTLHRAPFYPSSHRYGNCIQSQMSTDEGLLASSLHKCNPSCFQFFLGSHLCSVSAMLRPCSQVSIAEESQSTFMRDSKFKLPGRSILGYNSQFFSYLFIYPQDVFFSHTSQSEDPAESDSVPRSWHSSPGKKERSNQPSSFTREPHV